MGKMNMASGKFPSTISNDTSKRFNPAKPKGPGADMMVKSGKFPVSLGNDRSKRFAPPK